MMFGRILLFLVGIAFAPYGLMCLMDPQAVAEYTGMQLPNASALVEVVAMYGGLQFGLGALFIFWALRVEHLRTGLFVLVVTLGCLALGRAVGLLVHGTSVYNLAALAFESLSSVLGIVALRLAHGTAKASDGA
ncbi:MAG: DUF4345 family protein [Myxococcota bacterium]